MTLSDARKGMTLKVLKVGGEGALRRRLLEMGVMRGSEIRVERYAPLRDPIAVSVKGYSLALRVAEGCLVEVEEIRQDEG